jgi:L-cysteine:1D-myo-inositol 2-amino-2-deoxy-alpha-D-glucopyranoside ligase
VKSWNSPAVPTLPGTGLPVRIFDTATQRVVPTSPGQTARLYVCGITPYDATHMGHAATYVAFDTLVRAWRDAGHQVQYTQNVTDIDDPLLQRAIERGEDWRDIAERETELFRDDMVALRVVAPDDYIGAVEAIPRVADWIAVLQERGAVYQVDEDLYFDITSDPRFGGVANLSEAEMFELCAERGGDPNRAGKRNALDPLLWRAKRPDEPAWDTPLGHGRPGWHIECVAIALDHLGVGFDVQGGGRDLAFPHHEMSASHGAVATGEWPFARAYAHAGMVGLGGTKMSKSLGNLVFVSRLLADGVPGGAIRLTLLANHWRSDWEWTDQALADATARLQLWTDAVNAASGPSADQLLVDVRASIANDLDTPSALLAIDRWASAQRDRGGDDATAPVLVRELVDALLGVSLTAD